MKIFEAIYQKGLWGKGSGPGSSVNGLAHYHDVLQKLLGDKRPGTVVDLGCGYFEPYAKLDWEDWYYVGIDIVERCIKANSLFSGPKRVFRIGDWSNMEDLPDADIAICKDVLQHWCHLDICRGLERLSRYPCCLITNSVILGSRPVNHDIPNGDVRPLDLLAKPYSLRVSACETYEVPANPEFDRKQTLLWEPQIKPLCLAA
jgi:SAM-dependent methyltransferase